MADLKDFREKMEAFFKEASEASDAGGYQKLGAAFSTYEGRLREDIQEMTRDELGKIIRKLEAAETISDAERAVVELWIIGDAKHFLKMENRFKANMEELKSLQAEIVSLCGQQPSVETLSALRAILEYGARLNYALAFFLEKKERIGNFQKAMTVLGPEQRESLIDILKSKSKSKEL